MQDVKNKIIILLVLVIVALSVLLIVSNTAQARGSIDGSSTNTNAGTETENNAGLIDWLQSGTYRFDFTIEAKDDKATDSVKGSLSSSGGNYAVTQESGGFTTTIILKDGKSYVLDAASMTVFESDANGTDPTGGLLVDYKGMTKLKEGESVLDNKTVPYMEYKLADSSQIIRFYFAGKQVIAMEQQIGGTSAIMHITNATNDVPQDVFTVPSGYGPPKELGET